MNYVRKKRKKIDYLLKIIDKVTLNQAVKRGREKGHVIENC